MCEASAVTSCSQKSVCNEETHGCSAPKPHTSASEMYATSLFLAARPSVPMGIPSTCTTAHCTTAQPIRALLSHGKHSLSPHMARREFPLGTDLRCDGR